MKQRDFLDYDALREWQAEIISYEEKNNCFLLQTTRGTRLLFITPDEEKAKKALEMGEHLMCAGFNAAPRLIQNRFGDYYTLGFNGYYYLTDAFIGKLPNYANQEEACATAGCLGKFHRASQGFLSHKLPAMSFAAQKIGRHLLQFQSFTCLNLRMEQDLCYLFQSAATALQSFSPQKEQKLSKLYKRRGCFSLGSNIELLQCENAHFFIVNLNNCKAGGGICDLSELLLRIGMAESFNCNNSLQALKAYNRENRLEKEEMDQLFAALLLPVRAIKILNIYISGKSELSNMQEQLSAACDWEREKNRWVKRLLL